jgi:hypothetical protein
MIMIKAACFFKGDYRDGFWMQREQEALACRHLRSADPPA